MKSRSTWNVMKSLRKKQQLEYQVLCNCNYQEGLHVVFVFRAAHLLISSVLFVVLQEQQKNRNRKMTFCTFAMSSLVVNHVTKLSVKSLRSRSVEILCIRRCFAYSLWRRLWWRFKCTVLYTVWLIFGTLITLPFSCFFFSDTNST